MIIIQVIFFFASKPDIILKILDTTVKLINLSGFIMLWPLYLMAHVLTHAYPDKLYCNRVVTIFEK